MASVIFGLAYGKKATFEEFEAWYFALRDYIERPKVYRVEYSSFYDEIELTEIDQMPTKNLVILEARMGDEIVSKIMEITYSGSLYDPVEELAEYLKGMYEAAKDTTKYWKLNIEKTEYWKKQNIEKTEYWKQLNIYLPN